MLSITTIICILTCLVSIPAFSNPDWIFKLADRPYLVKRNKEYFRLISHAFVHGDWMHLLFNMLALYTFGTTVEMYYGAYISQTMGSTLFLMMYIISILAGSLPSYIKKSDNPEYLSIGASGGVAGVMFAFVIFNPWHIIYIYFIPVPAIIGAVAYLVYSSWAARQQRDNINHDAHFYGAIAGFVTTIALNPSLLAEFIQKVLSPEF